MENIVIQYLSVLQLTAADVPVSTYVFSGMAVIGVCLVMSIGISVFISWLKRAV